MLLNVLLLSCLVTLVLAIPTTLNYQPPDGYSLVWSDEFDGTSIDRNKWNHEITCTPFNDEQQCYTADATNSFVSNGMLNIVARQRTPIPANANGKKYTSARMVTPMNFRYGTFAARIKGPVGKGIWPAFWLLGTITADKGWPWVGEIDIMEYRGGSDPGGDDLNQMTLHFARGSVPIGTDVAAAHVSYGTGMALQNGARYGDAFHIFEATWTPESITGRVDGIEMFYINSTNTDHFNEFNNQAGFFNIILNVAVGGLFPNGVLPDDDPNYSQTMLVDWVRVYQQPPQAINALTSIPWIVPITPNATGVVNFIDSEVPLSIAPRGTFSVKVAYTVSHPSMLVLEVITADNIKKFGFGTKMVTPGTGTTTIVLYISTLINLPVELRVYGVGAETYFHNVLTAWEGALSAYDVRPVVVGTTMTYRAGVVPVATPNPDGVISSQVMVNGMNMNNPMVSLVSQEAFSVSIAYTTDVISQIVVDLLNSATYSKPATGNITVQPGTSTISIPMIWLNGETGNNNFFYNMFIVKKSIWDTNSLTAYQTPYVGLIAINGVSIAPGTTIRLPTINPGKTTDNFQPPAGYSLVWSDEFDGTSIDLNKWNHEITCTPFNNEQQCYTADATNSFVSNGMLNIVARQRTPIPANANGKKYTSARMVTPMNFRYGTFAARIKGPVGKGIWPAFWLLGTITPERGWPWVGEIDIMEYRGGSDPGGDDLNQMTLHFARGSVPIGKDVDAAHVYYGTGMALQNGARYGDAFHIFEATWTPQSITGRVDGVEMFYINSTNTDHFNEFNNQAGLFNIILNVAVGGIFPNGVLPDDDPNYAQTMLVDWVRVYQQTPQAINALTSIPWIFPPVPITPDPSGVVNFIDSEVPLTIAPRGTFSVKVSYTVSHPSVLVLEVITPDNIKFGYGTKMVTPGKGTDTIMLAITTLINLPVQLRVYGVAAETYFHNVPTAWNFSLSSYDVRPVALGSSMTYGPGVIPLPVANPLGLPSSGGASTMPPPTTNIPQLTLLFPTATPSTVVTTQLQVRVDGVQSYSNLQLKYTSSQPSMLYSGSFFPIPPKSPAIVSFPVTLNLTSKNQLWLDVVNAQGMVLTTLDTQITLIPKITTRTITAVEKKDAITVDATGSTTPCTSTSTNNINIPILIGGIIGGIVVGAILATLITYHVMNKHVSRTTHVDKMITLEGNPSPRLTTPWTGNPAVELTPRV